MEELRPEDFDQENLNDEEVLKKSLEHGFKNIAKSEEEVDLFATDGLGGTPDEEILRGRAD